MASHEKDLSVGRNLKIGVFHLGSGMADVLTTGVWNRIMISDLGFAAIPVSLLISLRYFLAPIGVWAGRVSDKKTFFGLRRLFWIWLGRGMMVLSTFGLGFATAELARHPGEATWLSWLSLAATLILFSLGSALSGSTFLALIYDRAAEKQRGRAVGIVWTFLLLGFTIGGIFFSVMLPEAEGAGNLSFSPNDLLNLFLVSGGLFAGLWFFSLLGEERRGSIPSVDTETETEINWRNDLALVWSLPSMRFFLFYLTLSMFFAFSQDPVLEPFAGDVFGMDAQTTNRFAAYWGGTAILGTIFFLWLSRRIPRFTNTVMSQLGVAVLFATFVLLTAMSLMGWAALMIPGLLLLGIGLGMWNVGTLGLMMDLSPLGRAGTFLGFWSMSVTLARGSGIAGGGIVRDFGLQLSGSPAVAYASVFGFAAVGLGFAYYALSRVHAERFEHDLSQDDYAAQVFAGAIEA